MCGLVGVFGNIDNKMRDLFTDMIQVNVLRGPHSTGTGFVGRDNNFDIQKAAVLPQDLMDRDFETKLKKPNVLLMGHNRWATIGEINDDNSHPFFFEGEKGKVIGAHNGTIREKWRFKDSHKFDTDSQALMNSISNVGVGETWKLMNGAAAISIYSLEDQMLMLATNGQRPLCFAILPNKRAVIWASEAWMIRAMASRNKIQIDKVLGLNANRSASFWMKGQEVKHQLGKLDPFVAPVYERRNWDYSGNYSGAGKNSSRCTGMQVYDSETKTWMPYAEKQTLDRLRETEKKGEIVYVGKAWPEFSKELTCELTDLQDEYGYYSSEAFDEEVFKENWKNCKQCSTSLVNDHMQAVCISPTQAVCGECYDTASTFYMDPGQKIN